MRGGKSSQAEGEEYSGREGQRKEDSPLGHRISCGRDHRRTYGYANGGCEDHGGLFVRSVPSAEATDGGKQTVDSRVLDITTRS